MQTEAYFMVRLGLKGLTVKQCTVIASDILLL